MRNSLKQLPLSLDEYEAIRLADYMQKEHEEAAGEMDISRSTFTRLLEKARGIVAAFLVEGRELCIEGGCIHFRGNIMRCNDCGHMFNISFDNEFEKCPACGSANLIDMAGGFGHGICCRQYNQKAKEK